MAEAVTGKKMNSQYVETNRIGDHICYYSDLSKMKAHYPTRGITKSLAVTFQEIADAWTSRLTNAGL
jgi:CDP-paratose 2-epimerase